MEGHFSERVIEAVALVIAGKTAGRERGHPIRIVSIRIETAPTVVSGTAERCLGAHSVRFVRASGGATVGVKYV